MPLYPGNTRGDPLKAPQAALPKSTVRFLVERDPIATFRKRIQPPFVSH